MTFSLSFYYFIAAFSLLNFLRIFIMMLASDYYDLRSIRKKRITRATYRPLISVVIPAYNEETGVLRTVQSVLANDYQRKQILVVNDGSKDKTLAVLRRYQRSHPGTFTIINQVNGGKAAALNRAIKRWAKGSLVMTLDADSVLHPQSISKMVEHFRDRRVLAAAANVKILSTQRLLGLAQKIEYIISYRMKRGLNTLNIEYIVGGVGSTFRRKALLRAGGYDTDTMTEDIDLTMKLLRIYGNSYYRIHYAADCVAYTEHVLNFRDLIRQRFRWKYGRFQTFVKNYQMFFSHSSKYNKRLTWYMLPYALVGEMILFLEPLLVGYIVYITLRFGDLSSMLSVYLIVTTFIWLLVLGEETEKTSTKLGLAFVLPVAYFLMYILSAVEYLALLTSIKKVRQLNRHDEHSVSWEHVERSSKPVVL